MKFAFELPAVREVPAPGPLRVQFRSRFVQNGMFEEDGEVWDSRDVLVAQSRQLGLLLREQWRLAASRLGGEVRAAEDAGDTGRVDALQRQLSELRTRRPSF